MRFSIHALVSAAVLGLASAYTQPVGDTPSGNPISRPGLGEIVPVGTPYTITWNPTTAGTVTLVLLRGPSTNVVPLYPIVEKTANTGVYVWTPSSSLEPDTTHYGIQLIVDATGQYQYTTQFGISNPLLGGSSSASSSSSASMASASSSSMPVASSSSATTTMAPSTTSMAAVSQIADGQPQAPAAPATANRIASASFPINSANATSARPTAMTSSSAAVVVAPVVSSGTAPYVVAPTGAPAANSSVIQPTVSMSVPATLQTSTMGAGATGASTSAPARATAANAAGRVVLSAGSALAGVGAVLALLLL